MTGMKGRAAASAAHYILPYLFRPDSRLWISKEKIFASALAVLDLVFALLDKDRSIKIWATESGVL